jgi:hypothetical protein
MSVFLCCTTAVAMSLYLKSKLSLAKLIAFLMLTLPATMINETKGTMFLLPIALLAPVIFLGKAPGSQKVKQTALTLVLIGGFLAAFIPVYDHFIQERWTEQRWGILDFFQMEGRVERYLVKDTDLGSQQTGKIDSLFMPFKAARHDTTQLVFGLGVANVSPSSLGPGFEGDYFRKYGDLMGPTTALFLWEIGLLGTAFAFIILYMIFQDARVAREAEGITGALALGWIAVTGIMFIAWFYKKTVGSDALSYLFWFYSGVIAAASLRIRRKGIAEEPATSHNAVARRRSVRASASAAKVSRNSTTIR